jgi:Ca2+-binding RTX toxin-like protein
VDDTAGNHADLAHVSATFAGLAVNPGPFTLGNDTVTLPAPGTYHALSGDDTIFGSTVGETVYGEGGNDHFILGSGAPNVMFGGIGDDTYYVEAVGDSIVELPGEGNDSVQTWLAKFALPDNVENLKHTGTGDHFIGIGNASNNLMIGGSEADYFIGGAGNDRLAAGSGAPNALQGGTGDDTYYVESKGDSIIEFANEGNDTVQTWLATFKLPDNVENLTFVTTLNHTGIGNALNNVFTASKATDTFTGAGGNDVFKFAVSSGHSVVDTVTDFNADNTNMAEHDHIDLSGRGLSFAALALTDGPTGVTIGIPGGDAIFLKNVTAHGLDAGDFFF